MIYESAPSIRHSAVLEVKFGAIEGGGLILVRFVAGASSRGPDGGQAAPGPPGRLQGLPNRQHLPEHEPPQEHRRRRPPLAAPKVQLRKRTPARTGKPLQ